MILTNQNIYSYAQILAQTFTDNTKNLPIKINFYLQKNKKLLIELAKDIDMARIDIAKKYGELNESNQSYVILPEQAEEAAKELTELFDLEQEVPISVINLEDLDENFMLTSAEMDALLFMIKD